MTDDESPAAGEHHGTGAIGRPEEMPDDLDGTQPGHEGRDDTFWSGVLHGADTFFRKRLLSRLRVLKGGKDDPPG